jgi:hypothetical protein
VVMDFETGQGYGSAEWHPAVVVCEVEVDTETGQVTCRASTLSFTPAK